MKLDLCQSSKQGSLLAILSNFEKLPVKWWMTSNSNMVLYFSLKKRPGTDYETHVGTAKNFPA
jgi:hypothetical protein